ncbi:MAG TPA: FliH/SctL family protein, partial [Myxococcota bacterium]|nr:FliH/SctL family protein [Myxococcota bacterium]
LAVSIARRVLGRELEFHPEAVVQIVKQALGEKARQRREISLRVHPDDLQMIREHKAELLEILSRTKEIAIRADPEVGRHGVIIETDAGIIDAQLETQLAAFERVLREVS